MLLVGLLIFILITLLPGFLAVRLLRRDNLHPLDTLLYAVGLGLAFNILVGAVANLTFGINLPSVVLAYVGLLVPLVTWSLRVGKNIHIRWIGWKPLVIPISLYLLAVGLQLQTTLISPNLVGSDIHLEYFTANMVLGNGAWDWAYSGGSTINTSLGIVLLLPVYKLLTGSELMWVFKVVCPMLFAVVPLVLFRIFRMQFGTLVAVLAVVFFVTMPMFTMDLVQLVRQQQSLLFFMLVVLVLVEDNLSIASKVALGALFTVGVIVTHIGIAIGFVGYALAGVVLVVLLAKFWASKVRNVKQLRKPLLPLLALLAVSVIAYVGYYSFASSGKFVTAGVIPMQIVGKTVEGISTTVWDSPPSIPSSEDKQETQAFFKRFSFLDPYHKEPLAQTAIGLDFGKASALGKVWRVLQYLVELCLIVGFFKILLKPIRSVKVEYMAFVIASFLVLAGIYGLSTYGWGLGTPRIWGITLLFISPLFVVGCGTVGKWIFKHVAEENAVLYSTIALMLPYIVFNMGFVFEAAKLQPVGFIDVPYSVALSGHRVDIASVFDIEDVVAMDWLKERLQTEVSNAVLYADTHGANLMVQRMGADTRTVSFKYIWQMQVSDIGYIFLRQWNVENGMITAYRDYGSRESHTIGEYDVVAEKIGNGTVVFDNGARVIQVK